MVSHRKIFSAKYLRFTVIPKRNSGGETQEAKSGKKRIEKTSVIYGDWASGYWGVGGYGGLLKRVENKSLMTFPDAQYSS